MVDSCLFDIRTDPRLAHSHTEYVIANHLAL